LSTGSSTSDQFGWYLHRQNLFDEEEVSGSSTSDQFGWYLHRQNLFEEGKTSHFLMFCMESTAGNMSCELAMFTGPFSGI